MVSAWPNAIEQVLTIIADRVDFKDFVTLVRNDILGLSSAPIPVKKMARDAGLSSPEELQEGIEALTYVILHMAKVNATEEEYHLIYQSSGLNT